MTATAPRTTPTDRPRGWRRFTPLGVWAALGAATWYVLAFNPTDRVADPTGPCMFHTMFGIDGPSCGGTRMYYYLLHGNLVEAARHHLVALVGLVYGLYWLAAWSSHWLFGKRLPVWRPSGVAIGIYFTIFMIYAVVLRNLPWPPFNWFFVENLT